MHIDTHIEAHIELHIEAHFEIHIEAYNKAQGLFINYVRQKGGRGGVKKSLRFLTRGRGGIRDMPYVRLHFLIFRPQFYPLLDNFLIIEAKIGKI